MSLNQAQIIGNLTKEPDVRQTPNGSTVATFTVATNYTWKDSNGQKQEKAEFHNIVAWGKLAEICQSYLNKGQKVYIQGRLQTRDWEAEDGSRRYKTEIIADNMIMLSSSSNGGAPRTNEPQATPAPAAKTEPSKSNADFSKSDDEISIDDLPF
jgi:single-strand DNA-binding protein